jgi:hypothetical protein
LHCTDHGNGKGNGYLPKANPVKIARLYPEAGKKIKAKIEKIESFYFASGLHCQLAG